MFIPLLPKNFFVGQSQIMIQKVLSQYFKLNYKALLRSQRTAQQSQEEAFFQLQESLRGTHAADETELGRADDLADFARRAKIRTYTDYAALIESGIQTSDFSKLFKDDLKYIGLSSATTAPKSKALPYNQNMVKTWDRFQMAMASIIESSSPIRFMRDQRLTWGSTPILESLAGVSAGYVSGFLSMKTPRLMKSKAFPRRDTLLLNDMSEKVSRMSQELHGSDIRLISGVPSYLLNVLEAIRKSENLPNLAQKFPNLRTCVYSATGIAAWRDQLDEVVGRPLTYIGCYAATEGAFGYEVPALNGGKNGLYSFHLDQTVFLFKLLNRKAGIVTIGELQEGDEVEILITTPNGLVNYSVGDRLRIHQIQPTILFEVLGRIGQGMNVAAEKVSQLELSKAMEIASRRVGLRVNHFFVHPGKSLQGNPAYIWNLVLDREEALLETSWTQALDEALKDINEDYREAREDLKFIDLPKVEFLPKQLIEIYFANHASRGQLKIPSIFESSDAFSTFVNRLQGLAA